MNPEGFEPPTFGSGIRRAAVAPWVRGVIVPRQPSAQTGPNSCGKKKAKTDGSPPLGIEPRTCRLTADRSANGALEAQTIPRPGIEPGSGG